MSYHYYFNERFLISEIRVESEACHQERAECTFQATLKWQIQHRWLSFKSLL